MGILTYIFIGALIMFFVDLLCVWLNKQDNAAIDYTFTNMERILVITLWPLCIAVVIIKKFTE
jgi:FtsH-binding integral membrane protein